MFYFISTALDTLIAALFRTITGKIFTDDQISVLTSHTVGKYLADFLPEPKDQRAAREKVEDARQHIEKASSIITAMQQELSAQSTELDKLLVEIEENKELAKQYKYLASTNKEQFSALRKEMEEALRLELVAQSEKGKRLRQIISFVFWFATLIIGAALSTYFKEILELVKSLLA